MEGTMSRWSLVVEDNTDKALRTFLAQTGGGKKGDLSNFVEEAVQEKLFRMTVANITERNSKYDQQEIMDIIEEAYENRS